jgi:hypothetical protein
MLITARLRACWRREDQDCKPVNTDPRGGADPDPLRGLSTVYQLCGVYASGLTPLILAALIGADHGRPWHACAYLVTTAVINVGATVLLEPS